MSGKIKITIHTERGEQTIEVDPHVAGYLSQGAAYGIEELYDGHGKLKRPQDKVIAGDLVKALDILQETFKEEVFNIDKK